MTLPRIILVGIVLGIMSAAWMVLGVSMSTRAHYAQKELGSEVQNVWGPGLQQSHVKIVGGNDQVILFSTNVNVDLKYNPQKRGLLWHRTYDVDFLFNSVMVNTASTAQNVRVQLKLPSSNTSYDQFTFHIGDEGHGSHRPTIAVKDGLAETTLMMPPGSRQPLVISYKTRGVDSWAYVFDPGTMLKDFTLRMKTDFDEIDFPAWASSPTERMPAVERAGWDLTWKYSEVLEARSIAMDMPKVLNAGSIVARITFFAPLALLLFFGVVMVFGFITGISLHPVQYAFIAGGFFSFHALLGYTVDIMPLWGSFILATLVSMLLASGYIHLVKGKDLSYPAAAAQLVYLILFSFSFFFEGLTGLTLTLLGITTLAGLMWLTAKVDWNSIGDFLPSMPKKPQSQSPVASS